jgi:hypothetical protein
MLAWRLCSQVSRELELSDSLSLKREDWKA